ncbi:MAG: sulfatase [Verrucomicrobiota bacterium]
MTKPLFTFLLIVGAALSFGAERPNILFIAVDDLRPELGTYGAAVHTPNLDALAASGIRFDRAYCNQAVCGASRLSLMGGLYPTKTGEQTFHVTDWRKRHPDLLTLNQHFKANGYLTLGTGKIYHGSNGGEIEKHNWDDWLTSGGKGYVLEESLAEMKKNQAANPDKDPKDFRATTTECADVPDDAYNDGARALVAAAKLEELVAQEQPFFFAVGFLKPHLPFNAPKRYWDLYERDDFALPENLSWPSGYPDYARNRTAGEMSKYSDYEGKSPVDFSDELNKRLMHGYAACVSYVDANVGHILEVLDASPAAENTIVVFWGDHGWKLGDHSSWCKHTNFEVDTRVPLLMRVPGKETGATEALVEFIDLYPTLCELAGLEVPRHVQGKSLVPLLEDLKHDHRTSAYSSYPHGVRMGHSIRMGDYRYTEWWDNNDKFETAVLTDLEADPGEESNVISDEAHASAYKAAKEELAERVAHAIE